MACEEFANFVAETLTRINLSLYEPFKKAFVDESISPRAFVDMTKEEMKGTFELYLVPIKFGIGLRKELISIQQQIRNEKDTNNSENIGSLRQFDTSCGKLTYSKCHVRPMTGNLLVPKHEFRWLSTNKMYSPYYVAKEIVRFIVACINGRKSGTIHFGIKPTLCQTGLVVGLVANDKYVDRLNHEIAISVEACFFFYSIQMFAFITNSSSRRRRSSCN
jgi:hypothetical protein